MPSEQAAASPFRWQVLALLFFSITINLLDRQVLSVAAPVLRDTLGISATGYGKIVFAFMLGMALTQLPAGMILDRWGPRRGLAAMCGWWSAANLLHAFARTVPQFAVFRFLLGMGECGNYSGGLKVITRWFPARERALAAGIFNSGSLAGPIIAVPLVTWLMLRFGWPTAFLLTGSLGFLWAVAWGRVYRDPGPASHLPVSSSQFQVGSAPDLNLEPRNLELTLGRLFRIRQTWGVFLVRALAGPVSQFYWYWLPEYLKRERHLSLEMIGLLAWIPYFCGGVGNLAGGWFSSHLIRRGWGVDAARKLTFGLAVLLTATSGLIPFVSSATAAMALICTAVLGINAFASTFMASLADIFPERAVARVAGITGLGDSSMSMFLMLATGAIVDRFSYLPIFISAACAPMLALAVIFLVVRRVEPCLGAQ
jgi:ACS family hexuronate transporter-like MFS transporter